MAEESLAWMPTAPELPGQSQIWRLCPGSRLEIIIYLDCPGFSRILRYVWAVMLHGRLLGFSKCKATTLSLSKQA